VRGHLTACCDELSQAGLPFDAALPLGIMIETPAAALLAESLGKHCDFFSVGTNDLTQYTLAADRSNPAMAALGDYLHPAVLRLIALTVQGGDVSAIPVSVCGEMAADPLAAPLLLALGASGLSMAPASFSRVRQAIGRVTLPEAAELLTAAMSMDTAAAVRNFLQEKMAEKDA